MKQRCRSLRFQIRFPCTGKTRSRRVAVTYRLGFEPTGFLRRISRRPTFHLSSISLHPAPCTFYIFLFSYLYFYGRPGFTLVTSTGGGLLRSVGGWASLTTLCRGSDWVKSDRRIGLDSDFVNMVLRHAYEQIEIIYRLRSEGYGFDDIAERVAQVMNLPLEIGLEKSRRPQVVQARSLFCYWAGKKLGMSMTEIANRIGLTPPAVSIATRRGEEMARQKGYFLLKK